VKTNVRRTHSPRSHQPAVRCTAAPFVRHRKRSNWLTGSAIVLALATATATFQADAAEPVHGVAISGELKYPADFSHFDYVNPDAPKGGQATLAVIGTFDNLNPFILKGVSAAAAVSIYDTLTVQALDEPFSEYGLLAESIEIPDDKRWVIFNLRKEARWHDGVALTAEDVVWTFDKIKSDGHPFYKSYYGKVAKAEAIDSHTVKFSFSEGNNAELPMIMGQLAVLPKHFWEGKEFGKTITEPLLGSGPYKFKNIDIGRSVSYELVDDYWAKDLPVNIGQDNIATLKYDYYKDSTVALQALKAGEIDFRSENVAKNWATAYDTPAIDDGRLIKELIPDDTTQPMQGFILNNRKKNFADIRIRKAMGLAFDFEWMKINCAQRCSKKNLSYRRLMDPETCANNIAKLLCCCARQGGE